MKNKTKQTNDNCQNKLLLYSFLGFLLFSNDILGHYIHAMKN